MPFRILLTVALLILNSVCSVSTFPQAEAMLNQNFISVIEYEDNYQVLSTNVQSGVTTLLRGLKRNTDETVQARFPQTEIDAMLKFRSSRGYESNETKLSRQLRLTIDAFKISPDGSFIVFALRYQACIPNPGGDCFGISVLSTMDIKTSVMREFLKIASHLSNIYYCGYGEYYIRRIEWGDLQAQTILFDHVAISGQCQFRMPLYLLNIAQGHSQLISENAGWEVNQQTRQILAVTEERPAGRYGHVVHIYSVNLLASDPAYDRAWYLGNDVLSVSHFRGRLEGAIGNQYAILKVTSPTDFQPAKIIRFDVNDLTKQFSVDNPLMGYPIMSISPDQQMILVEMDEQGLLLLNPVTMQSQSLLQQKITSARWLDSNTILVFKADTSSLEVIDTSGKVLRQATIKAPANSNQTALRILIE